MSGCKKTELTLAGTKLDFVAGQAETKSLAVKAGTATQVDPREPVEGLSAGVDGKAITVMATAEVQPGSYDFTVLGKGKTKATFTVTVAAKAVPAVPGTPEKGPGSPAVVTEPTFVLTPPGVMLRWKGSMGESDPGRVQERPAEGTVYLGGA